jgi:hypothetical protein
MEKLEAPKSLIEACSTYREIEEIADKQAEELKNTKQKLQFLESKILEFLDIIDQDTVINDFGKFEKVPKITYNLPDTQDKQLKFFEYVKESGMWDDLFKMSSVTFNSVVKTLQKEKQKEHVVGFLPPGVDSKEPHYILSIKKK